MVWLVRWLRDVLQILRDLLRRLLGAQCSIPWRPNALAPVFYGHRDYGATDGAPGDVRIFFPSLDGSPASAEILRDCGRYPLVVFAHGHCSSDTDHYLKWFEVPAQLARAGYVVAVPRLPQMSIGTSPLAADDDLDLLRNLIIWVRTGWVERAYVAAAPATGLVGHSFGGGLAGRLATEGGVAAYASLSGVVAAATREAITAPKLFIWGSSEFVPPGVVLTDSQWAAVDPPKHRVVVDDMAHWDYLPTGRTGCENDRGPCQQTWVAWDLLTMFIANYLPPPSVSGLPSQIPESLVPPLPLPLTTDQQFYAGGWLSGYPAAEAHPATCHVTLAWQTPAGAGTVTTP